jgi:hypothetical protein
VRFYLRLAREGVCGRQGVPTLHGGESMGKFAQRTEAGTVVLYDVVLFLHILTVAIAFFLIGIAVHATLRCCTASTLGEARDGLSAAARIGRFMPVITVLLLATGGYLTQSRWSWSTSWVDVSVAGLLLVTAVGGGLIATRERGLHRKLDEVQTNGGALARDPMLLGATGINIGLVAAVMFVMVVKPALAVSIIALAIGAAAGFAALSALSRSALSVSPQPQ